MIKNDVLLRDFTTFKAGGKAKYFANVRSKEELKEVFFFILKKNLKFFVLGNGSNVLFDDRGFSGVVIKNEMKNLKILENRVFVDSGFSLIKLAKFLSFKNMSGLEFAVGIPASLGGAVYMNAGAYGNSIFDVLKKVEFMKCDGKLEIFKKEEIDFSYRYSFFQKKKGMITSLVLSLKKSKSAKENLKDFFLKRKNQPFLKNFGSVFKNPKNECAGHLVDKLNLKGVKIGGARISEKHGNFIINEKNATSKDVLKLIDFIKKKIKKHYKIDLKEEVFYLPYD